MKFHSNDFARQKEPARHFVSGTAKIFLAELLFVPTGLITAAYLSRRFGPEGYGLLMLAYVPVILLESNVAAALTRPAIKLVSEAKEWGPVGTAVLRLYLMAGAAIMFLLWATAVPLAALLDEPALAGYLRLLALDVPIFLAAQAHRNIIVGLGHFHERAVATVVRWVSRLVLIVLLVQLSGTLQAAVWGSIGASAIELLVYRFYVRPRLLGRQGYSLWQLCRYAVPLVAAAFCISLFSRLDLILLRALGGTAAEAGYYAVAQNLSLLPGLLSFTLAPALISTIGRALRDDDVVMAQRLGRQTLRTVLLLAPVAAIAAGAASEIVTLIFGQAFVPAAPLLRLLIFGALALLLLSVTTSILVSAGKPRWTLHTAWPLLLCAAASHLLLIPRLGAWGAALGTTVLALVAALASVGMVHHLWRIAPLPLTVWRTLIICVVAYVIAALLPAPGLLVIPKLVAATLFSAFLFLLSGEFSSEEIKMVREFIRRRTSRRIELPSEAS